MEVSTAAYIATVPSPGHHPEGLFLFTNFHRMRNARFPDTEQSLVPR